MNYDINEIRITGTVVFFNRIPTKTGKSMATLFVRCWKQMVSVVAFDALAEQTIHSGDRIEVKGYAQGKNYTGKDGIKHEGWQIVAKELGPETAARDAGQGGGPGANPGGDPPAYPEPVTAPPLAADSKGRPPMLNDPSLPF